MDTRTDRRQLAIHDYPAEIERLALQLHSLGRQHFDVKEYIRDIKADTERAVYDAKGESEKQLYKDDRERADALGRILRTCDAYLKQLDRERELSEMCAKTEAELERRRREYRLLLIDYEVDRLGRREVA